MRKKTDPKRTPSDPKRPLQTAERHLTDRTDLAERHIMGSQDAEVGDAVVSRTDRVPPCPGRPGRAGC
jgi:hypothetical protein